MPYLISCYANVLCEKGSHKKKVFLKKKIRHYKNKIKRKKKEMVGLGRGNYQAFHYQPISWKITSWPKAGDKNCL